MKKIFITLLAFVFAGRALAATPTPTTASSAATPTTAKTSQIDDLKERLATKVAELRQSQKKAIYGTVKATSVSTITVETKTSDVKIELTDSISVFQTIKDKRTELTTDDLEKGDNVVVFGDYDTGLDLLKAKVIVIQNDVFPQRINGLVTAVDKTEFTATVDLGEGKTYVVDIEKTTAMYVFDKEQGVIKGGFSKVEPGVVAVVIGTPVAKKENQISALRFLDIGNVTGATPTPTPSLEATPTATASGTPKATPKPTAKTTPTPTP
jgi:hypothetical protein